MTNEQIITAERIEAMKQGIIGGTGKTVYLLDGTEIDEPEEMHTFQGWKQLGYKVRKGEHAKVTTKLWKAKNSKTKYTSIKTGEEKEMDITDFYLCKSFLFSQSQVEREVA